ncbi:MAG TPA: aminotransferase class III-fold pyridoxal phosphate-dependent enzyme, partial [Flavisolibacter sp.]|nr:aminotransferase class III-fold pyridoxal phosphate-dependent enzyme [Flavisolibacter sp.]
GGHPVCCAAGKAALEVLLAQQWSVKQKEALFTSLLTHPQIKAVRSFGLWMAIEFIDFATCKKVIDHCIQRGVISDWFLFASNCLRISPPLVITQEQIRQSAAVILEAIENNS